MIKKIMSLSSLVIFLLGILAACVPADRAASPAPIISNSIADIFDKYRQEIPEQMKKNNIPGLSIAVVDDKGILWEESFGYTDWDNLIPVTPSTLFSIQSMSKSFTATAAMFAAQDGLVDLDAPITTYLPDFHVHSIFEEHPEQMMTLRILLSHTAGFPHDASYGGNNDHAVYSLEKQIESISDTWLMFPVGARFSYSNVGIDLAAYILQVRSGMPFIQYVQEKVLRPIGMMDSTLDYHQVRADSTRSIGHIGFPLRPPVDFLLVGSGGVWTSAADMARYLQFHINKGAIGGNRLLRAELAETMYSPPNAPAQSAYGKVSYALGITVDTIQSTQHFQHGGGGFGFNDSMVWYPDLKLGSVVLSNAEQSESYSYKLSEEVLSSIISSNLGIYRERASNAGHVSPVYPLSQNGTVASDRRLKDLIESKALPADTDALLRRSSFTGTYITTAWGFPSDTIDISILNGELAWTYHGGESQYSQNATLTEVQPGLFFSENGIPVDLRGPTPRMANTNLIKANTQILPVKIALYGICGLLFLSALLFRPVRFLVRRIRRKVNSASSLDAAAVTSNYGLDLAGVLAVLVSFFSFFCLVAVALVPNLIHVPWPLPYVELTWWQFFLVSLPFINLLLAVGLVLLTGVTMRNRTQGSILPWYRLAVGLTLLTFNLAIMIL
jgi:CubicO group peptidase (beta-lactamase class C family)